MAEGTLPGGMPPAGRDLAGYGRNRPDPAWHRCNLRSDILNTVVIDVTTKFAIRQTINADVNDNSADGVTERVREKM